MAEQDNQDDELEIVEVDELPAPGSEPPAKKDEPAPEGDEEDDEGDEDEGDSRLADKDENDPDEAKRERRRQERVRRKESQKAAQRELQHLRNHSQALEQRLAALEGSNLGQTEAQLERQIADIDKEIARAELIMSKAMEAGEGADVVAALKLRDEARDAKLAVQGRKDQVEALRKSPKADPRVVSLGQEWMSANSWYDPASNTPDSRLVQEADAAVLRDGYDPASRAYWQELSRRVQSAFNARTPQREERKADDDTRRRGPPVRTTRETVPNSTRKEVYVTPERRQAMEEAGIWDDPVRRKSALKAYQEYDRNNPR